MRKILPCFAMAMAASFFMNISYGQKITISGTVQNSSSKEWLGAVSVMIKGSVTGSFTNDKGLFAITVKALPVTLLISSIGFESQEITVTDSRTKIEVALKTNSALGLDVVVAANRVPQRILESPVSVERINATFIKRSAAASYYDVLANLKGVDVITSSLTFKTPTTRGFSASGNTRFNQLVDGMDNMAPGLNFSLGAILGVGELDVESMELLPGASSALYGPGGMNGTLLISSKNPFKYQGFSYQLKQGIMHTDGKERPASPYYNWSLRWGKKISEKFAFKITTELIQAKDWQGNDYRNYRRAGTASTVIEGNRQTDANYDGINTYGDETTLDIMKNVLIPISKQAPFLAPYIYALDTNKAINVSRTGYKENEAVIPNTINFKMSGALHYKLSAFTEAVVAVYWGTGNTVYSTGDRYSLKDFKIGQYKIELNNPNWFARAYTTQENAGESYNITVASRLYNEAWKPSQSWYPQYAQAYLSALLAGAQNESAHNAARAAGDVGRPAAGSEQFNKLFNEIAKKPIKYGGGKLLDKSDLYSAEGNYNFTHLTKDWADIIVGANYKNYVLNSENTLFADSAGPIKTNEYGIYLQAARQVLPWIKLTMSGRYDKNDNYKGRFTPRATALIKLAANNNLRLSYQTAYRFPSNQQQWINLEIGSNTRSIGGDFSFWNYFNFINNPLYDFEKLRKGDAQKIIFKELKPESLTSYEVGYKGLLLQDKLLADMYVYYGQYQDFLGSKTDVQSRTGAAINIGDTSNGKLFVHPVNTAEKVKTYGFGISIDWRMPQNFMLSANLASDNLYNVSETFVGNFNTPKYKTNLTVSNTGFGKKDRAGFAVTYRWQDTYFYTGGIARGQLPAVSTLDAQVSYKFPDTKSVVKLGANNLLNQYYYTAVASPQIGGLYYVSFGYNIY